MYHYTESGLDNIWLENGYETMDFDGEEAVSVLDFEKLHETIGRTLANQSCLNSAEFRFLRKELGLSQHRIAELLGVSDETVSLWERGNKIPKVHDRLIRILYLEHLDGNVQVANLINELIDLDEKEAQQMVFADRHGEWRQVA